MRFIGELKELLPDVIIVSGLAYGIDIHAHRAADLLARMPEDHPMRDDVIKNFQTIKRARFWMTFGQEYLTHLRIIQNIGMASIEPITLCMET